MAGAKEGVSPSYLGKANKKGMLGEQSDCGGKPQLSNHKKSGVGIWDHSGQKTVE